MHNYCTIIVLYSILLVIYEKIFACSFSPIRRNSLIAGMTRHLRIFSAPGSCLQLLQVRTLFCTKVMLALKTVSDESS